MGGMGVGVKGKSGIYDDPHRSDVPEKLSWTINQDSYSTTFIEPNPCLFLYSLIATILKKRLSLTGSVHQVFGVVAMS